MAIIAIAAVDKNNGIGCEGKLLFRIPEDMEFFRETTEGHPVIMGRLTFESMKCKPLYNRTNVIVTSDPEMKEEYDGMRGTIVCSIDEVDYLVDKLQDTYDDVYIIGGGQLYEYFLPKCEKVYLTRYYREFRNVDTYFPDILKMGFKLGPKIKYGTYDSYPYYIDEYVRS